MKLPNMAADLMKSSVDYDSFKRSLQHIEYQSIFTKDWISKHHGENELLKAEIEDIQTTTRKLMEIFGIQAVRPKD